MTESVVGDLLRQRFGLDPGSLGRHAVMTAVGARQQATGLSDPSAYAQLLSVDPEELDALAEELLVNETWFFRDEDPLRFLAHHVTVRNASRAGKPWRLLSLACSSGEEPYSAAISLLGVGVQPQQFHIDAVDLSRRALRRAQAAVYRPNSFRGDWQTHDRARHFRELPDGTRELDPAVRNLVRFRQANAVNDQLLAGERPYDVIFCRNMLIYLEQEARSRVLRRVDALLEPDGVLVVGHVEPMLLTRLGWRPVGGLRAFAYQRGPVPASGVTPPPTPRPSATPLAGSGRFPRVAALSASALAPPAFHRAPPAGPSSPALLQEAERQADLGKLDDARSLCERALREHGPTAPAYYLLGLICQAQGKVDQAEGWLAKAVYLEPDHYEALIQLSLLYAERGDRERALTYRDRAERRHRSRAP